MFSGGERSHDFSKRMSPYVNGFTTSGRFYVGLSCLLKGQDASDERVSF